MSASLAPSKDCTDHILDLVDAVRQSITAERYLSHNPLTQELSASTLRYGLTRLLMPELAHRLPATRLIAMMTEQPHQKHTYSLVILHAGKIFGLDGETTYEKEHALHRQALIDQGEMVEDLKTTELELDPIELLGANSTKPSQDWMTNEINLIIRRFFDAAELQDQTPATHINPTHRRRI